MEVGQPDASHCWMDAIADRPLSTSFQIASGSLPAAQTAPRPVTRIFEASAINPLSLPQAGWPPSLPLPRWNPRWVPNTGGAEGSLRPWGLPGNLFGVAEDQTAIGTAESEGVGK